MWRGRSAALLTRALPALEHDEVLPPRVRRLVTEVRQQLARLDEAIGNCEVEIKSSVARPTFVEVARIG